MANAAFSPSSPPSTSIHGSSLLDSQSRRRSRIFGNISGRNFCPPNPGLTVITSTMSQRCSTCSTKAMGLAGFEHRTDLLAKLANLRQHAMEVNRRRRLGLNKQMIGAGFRKIVEITLRLDDHQVHIERLGRRAAHCIHDRGAEGDVRHEPAVHDVDMNPIGAGLIDRTNFLAEPPQIGGKNGGRDNDRLHDAPGRAELARGKMNRSIALAKPSSS